MSFEDKSLGQLHANGCLGVSSCEITDYYNKLGECPCRALLLLSHCKILKYKQRYLVINLCLSVNQCNDFPVILCDMHSFIRQDGCYRRRANRWCYGHQLPSQPTSGLTTTLASTLMLSTGISNDYINMSTCMLYRTSKHSFCAKYNRGGCDAAASFCIRYSQDVWNH